MKDLNDADVRMGATAENSTDALDDTTQEIMDDYSRKFLSFIQQEKNRIRKQALEESEKLLAEADKKGRAAYERAVKDAAEEAQGIVARSKDAATKLTMEATRLFRATAELRDNVDHQVDELRQELQTQAESIAQFLQQRDDMIVQARDKLHQEFQSCSSLVAELEHALENITKPMTEEPPRQEAPKPETPRQEVPSSQFNRAHSKPSHEPAAEPTKGTDDSTAKANDKTFVGTLNLDVNKANPGLSRRFKESLSKVPGLEISLADDTARDRTRIVAFASRPILLLNILHQMSMVKSVVTDEESVKVVLQDADRWVG